MYWICVVVLAIYALTAAAAFVAALLAGEPAVSQFVFPACVIGAALIVFFIKRRPEP